MHLPSGQIRFPPPRHDEASQALEYMAELVAGGYSRRQMRDGAIDLLSRIDRVFCSLDTTDLLALRAQTAYTRSVYDTRLSSDHAPLELVLHAPQRRRSSTAVPRWVAHIRSTRRASPRCALQDRLATRRRSMSWL